MRYKLQNTTTEILISEKLPTLANKKMVLIVDEHIEELYKDVINRITEDSPRYIFTAKEKFKTIDEIIKIYSFFVKNNVNRETVVVGIGGGITTDITSFAVSTFKRGCRLQLIPTTFLGMIDASIGGKTAINFEGVKNAIGTFYPAEKVFIYPPFLKTLAEKNLRSGWTECLKASLIKDNGLYELLVESKKIITKEIIQKAIAIKIGLCKKDLYDSGERRKLNLGHTFAHVLESVSNYQVNHGDAVAIGIRKAAEYSRSKRMLNEIDFLKIIKLLDRFDLPKNIPDELKKRVNEIGNKVILQDKKAGEKVRLVLFNGFQDIVLHKVNTTNEIIALLVS